MTRHRLRCLPMLPVLRRELLGILRAKRTFVLLVLSVALSSGVALFVWPHGRDDSAPGDGFATTAAAFAIAQHILVLLLIPAVAAGAIVGEREAGTWDSLVSTQLSPRSVVASKAIASVLFTLMVVVCALPVFFTFQLLGGVSFQALFNSTLVTLSMAVTATLIALHASAGTDRTAKAAFRSLARIGLLSAGLSVLSSGLGFVLGILAARALFKQPKPAPVARIRARQQRGQKLVRRRRVTPKAKAQEQPVGRVLLFGIPLGIAISALMPWLKQKGLPGSAFHLIYWEILEPEKSGATPLYVAATLLLDGFLYAVLLRKVFAPDAVPIRPQPAGPARTRWRDWRPERSFIALGLLDRRDRLGSIAGSPVFLKEIECEPHGSSSFFLWTSSSALVVLLLNSVANSQSLKASIHSPVFIGAWIACLLIAIVGSGALSRELRSGNLDLLRSTLLGPSEIAFGKLLSAFFAGSGVFTAFLFLLPAAFLHIIDTPGSPELSSASSLGLLLSLLLLVLSLAVWASASSIASSIVFGSGLAAPAAAYVLASLPFAVALFVPTMRPTEPIGQILASTALVAAALVAWLIACQTFARLRWRDP